MAMQVFLIVMLGVTYSMVSAKRIGALVRGFSLQSLALCAATLWLGFANHDWELYVVAVLLFAVKVVAIPNMLRRIVRKIHVEESLGLFVNPLLSLAMAILFTWASAWFTSRVLMLSGDIRYPAFVVSFTMILTGFFIMVTRIKAVSQVVGLLAMENGIFLLAARVSGGMPFFVEIAIFFDVFVCVLIMGVFLLRINKVFTHIDVDKLTSLKG